MATTDRLDIRFATSLFNPDEWDPHILQDFMNLLTLTLKLFQGQQEGLGKIKQHCQNLEISDQPVVGQPQVIAKEFNRWRTYVNDNFRKLVKSLGYHEHRKQDKNKVPGATFTELLIQNEIQRQRRKIVSRPVKITPQDTEHVSGVDLNDATKVISNIIKNSEKVYWETKADFEKELTKKGLKLADSQHWHSRTIAVVADADTGIIVTGATKPAAPEIPILKDAADNISRIRVGEDFGSIIDDCSKDVWDLYKRAEKTEESAKLYDAVVNAKKDSIAKYQNIPSSEKGIMIWAFGRNFKGNFEFKRPCTRCQRLYSGWVLHEMPDTPEKKLAGLTEDQLRGLFKYSSANKYPCNYCAETVAAAKLHALYYGTLTLVLSKDTDKIRASDKARTQNEARAPVNRQ